MWEYYPVSLSAGTATFQIDIANTTSKPNMAPLADRNIDAIMLTTNLTDIKMRALNEQGSTPLDGLHTQRDEVYMKVSTTIDHCWKIVAQCSLEKRSSDVSNDFAAR